VAVRWTLDGHHDGPGRLGEPTGKRLALMGVSHFRVGGGKILEHWMVTDELSLHVQLAMPTA
jgi:predicted ester cyclase